MWDSAVPLQVGKAQSRALCAEHQLIHLFFNGCINEAGINMRWLPDALVVLNQEVRVPIYRWFSGVGFVEGGNVFERPSAIDFKELVGSYGAGLRIATPFALLRADVAQLWSPEVGQPTARWTFGIGHTF
jgi:hypothetical protein